MGSGGAEGLRWGREAWTPSESGASRKPRRPPRRAAQLRQLPGRPRPERGASREVAEFLELTAEPEGSRPQWARSGTQARPRGHVQICGPPTDAGLLRLRHTPPLVGLDSDSAVTPGYLWASNHLPSPILFSSPPDPLLGAASSCSSTLLRAKHPTPGLAYSHPQT
nr:uncharacterized protein LOC119627655 [Chlorocebus sabaeus]